MKCSDCENSHFFIITIFFFLFLLLPQSSNSVHNIFSGQLNSESFDFLNFGDFNAVKNNENGIKSYNDDNNEKTKTNDNNNNNNINNNNKYNDINKIKNKDKNDDDIAIEKEKYDKKKNEIIMQKILKFSSSINSAGLTTVLISILQKHYLSSKIGQNSQLNFIISFISDIINSLLLIIERRKHENCEIFVNFIPQLRSSLLVLLFQKYFIENLVNENNRKNDNKNKNKNVNSENKIYQNEEIFDEKILLEIFRDQCKMILHENETFYGKKEITVMTTYLIIEILLQENVTVENSNFQISKNMSHKFLSYLGNEYLTSQNHENEFSFLTNFDGALLLYTTVVFQICLKLPFNSTENSFDSDNDNNNNNNNKNNDYNNKNTELPSNIKYRRNVKQFTFLDIENATRVILCLAGGVHDEDDKSERKSKFFLFFATVLYSNIISQF